MSAGSAFTKSIHTLRSGDFSKCNASILDGHYSSALCHLGNISYRLGNDVPLGQKPDHLGDNRQVLDSFEMIRENLDAAGFKLDRLDCRIGPVLQFDAQNEKFVDNNAANALLTRNYRHPFVVPDEV